MHSYLVALSITLTSHCLSVTVHTHSEYALPAHYSKLVAGSYLKGLNAFAVHAVVS